MNFLSPPSNILGAMFATLCLLLLAVSCAPLDANKEKRIESIKSNSMECDLNEIPLMAVSHFVDTLASVLTDLGGDIFIDSCSRNNMSEVDKEKLDRLISNNSNIITSSRSRIFGEIKANGSFVSFNAGPVSNKDRSNILTIHYLAVLDGRYFGGSSWRYRLLQKNDSSYEIKYRESGGILD